MKKISESQVLTRIEAENPWWKEPHRTPALFQSWKPRPYIDLFFPLVVQREVRRAVILMGPRRVGKTVLIHHVISKLLEGGTSPRTILYVTVDHPLYNGLGLENFLHFLSAKQGIDLEKEETFLFFDEIQYLKDWELHLKAIVDRYPTVRCVASGSAAAALRLKSIESGAGRFTDFLLPPLAFYEYLSLLGEVDCVQVETEESGLPRFETSDIEGLNGHFLNYLNFGGYPEVVFSEAIQRDPGRFIKSDIIDKVLLRDLPSLYGIRDIQELNSLFTSLAYNTASEVSLNELSKNSGVAKNTLSRYIEYLEAAFLIKTVKRVDKTGKKFERANFFKVYLTNPSIRSALFAPLEAGDEEMGSLVETGIFAQWFHSEFEKVYARWQGGGVVDIVGIHAGSQVDWAVEVKWSDRFANNPEDLKSLITFCHKHNLGDTLVTTRTIRKTEVFKNTWIEFVPAALYCYQLGYNILKRGGAK